MNAYLFKNQGIIFVILGYIPLEGDLTGVLDDVLLDTLLESELLKFGVCRMVFELGG